jgi:hypothetical protein
VWLGAVLIAPASLHPCPMHGNHSEHMAAAQTHVAVHGGQPGAPADDSSKPCTCLGTCCTAAAIAVPSLALVELHAVPVRVVAVSAPVRDMAAPVVAPEYSHPFANGPPASRST